MLVGGGGLAGYLGTTDAVKLRNDQGRRSKAALIYEAMAYQIAKEIGAASAVLKAKSMSLFDRRTGIWKSFISSIRQYIDWISDVVVFPGEMNFKHWLKVHFAY
ncbi:hypothetical protein PO124_08915 [Bacillus licheniformis]|nr:hypothetical protein [Bacillus licheniformis]